MKNFKLTDQDELTALKCVGLELLAIAIALPLAFTVAYLLALIAGLHPDLYRLFF